MLNSKGMNASKLDFVTEVRSILHYIDKVATISSFLGEQVYFTSGFSYTAEEYRQVLDAAKIIGGQCIFSEKDITSNATCSLVVDEGAKNVELLKNMTDPTSIRFVENSNESIVCFGKTLELPQKVILLNMVTPKISFLNNECKKGDVVQVEWIPATGFECKVEYVKRA